MYGLDFGVFDRIKSKKDTSASLQFVKYFVTGAIAAAVDITSFMVFATVFLIDYRVAIFLGFTLGTIVNFMLCNAFVFDRKSLTFVNSCARHYISSLGGLVTNEAVMILLVGIMSSGLFVSKILATFAAFAVNFIFIKYFAFNSNIKLL